MGHVLRALHALPLNPTMSLRWVFSHFRHKVREVKGEGSGLKLMPQNACPKPALCSVTMTLERLSENKVPAVCVKA